MFQSKINAQPLFIKLLFLCTFTLFLFCGVDAQRKNRAGAVNKSSTVKPSKPSVARPSAPASRPSKPATSKPAISNNNRNINAGNKTNVGNKVNIDNSKKNVNINVDRSKNININNNRNTVVRRNTRVYSRPPYRYGGRRFYAYHPYYYHPYRPFYWGPVWHPWGFFVATLATTAIIVSINNQKYHYDQGVYYVAGNGGYTVVQAPVGATVTTLPSNAQVVQVNETTNNYYYGGAYYDKTDKGYTVVAPTAGTVVENLPEGGEEVTMGDQKYVKVGETYYQPIQQDGKDMYEVANVEEDK